MKCSVCKKEFGNGANCKNCGTDRVTGLGNYGGYTAPSNSSANVESSSRRENPHQIVDNEPKIVKVSSMICHACGEIIPADSKFCPHCSTSLYVTCPKCGHEYSSQYPACSKCGTNRQKYEEEQTRIRWAKIDEENKRKREQEKARKQHEEWLKTPEGKAETERKRKAEAEVQKLKQRANEIRVDLLNQCSTDKSTRSIGGIMAIVISPIILYCLLGRGGGSGGEALIVTLLCLVAFVMFIGGVYYLILGIASNPEDYISEYKRNHPDEPVSKYL